MGLQLQVELLFPVPLQWENFHPPIRVNNLLGKFQVLITGSDPILQFIQNHDRRVRSVAIKLCKGLDSVANRKV